MAAISDDTETINLNIKHELLLAVRSPGDKFTVQLITGSAEIFGSELEINKEYEFSYFSSVAVFTWHGCTLTLRKEASKNSKYRIITSEQIPRIRDLYEYLKESCTKAYENNTDNPITLLAGPSDAGKSTLCRVLLNYATRDGREPLFIDLDVGQSSLSIAGTLSVLPVHESSNFKGKFNEKDMLVYYFGYKSPGHNMHLYKLFVEKVGRTMVTCLKRFHRVKSSGVLIDTCGWVEGGGYRLLTEIIDALNVNMVLVLSQRSLYYKLKEDVSRKTEIIYVDKFTDVVSRDRIVRADNRDFSVYEYFYGSPYGRQLQPYTIKVNFNDLQIFKANFPMRKTYDTTNVVSVVIEPNILYQVLALSYAERIEKIPLSSIYGFICIVEIAMDSEVATVLSPKPGPLPTKYLLMGDIKLTPRERNSELIICS